MSACSRPYGWDHCNDARSTRAMQRRARLLAAIECGVPMRKALRALDISDRTARRYLRGTGYTVPVVRQ